jgi:hypothetical protein
LNDALRSETSHNRSNSSSEEKSSSLKVKDEVIDHERDEEVADSDITKSNKDNKNSNF